MLIADSLRQLRFAKEFRIAAPIKLQHQESLETALTKLQELMSNQNVDAMTSGSPEGTDEHDRDLLRLVANQAWGLERRLKRLAAVDEKQVTRFLSVLSELQSALAERGVEVIDFTGQPYVEDERWDGITGGGFEGTGVVRDMEFPRLMHRGRMLQRGWPIVDKE